MAMMEDDIKSLEVMRSLPYEQLRENLRKVFEDYGVSKTNQNRWLDFTDFYCLLDKNGQLSEEGRATMEKWKDYFGDPLKEMSFAMYMID